MFPISYGNPWCAAPGMQDSKASPLFLMHLAVPPSARIDNTWVRLLLCPVFCGYLTRQSNVLPSSPFSPHESEISSPKEEQGSGAAEHSGLRLLGVRVNSLNSKGHLPQWQGSPHAKAHFTGAVSAGESRGILNNLLIWYLKGKGFGLHYVQPGAQNPFKQS